MLVWSMLGTQSAGKEMGKYSFTLCGPMYTIVLNGRLIAGPEWPL